MRIELLYFEGCPHWRTADERLSALDARLGVEVSRRVVASTEEAEALRFAGSPTILVDGRDPFPAGEMPLGLSCRLYPTSDGPAGAPTVAQLESVLAPQT